MEATDAFDCSIERLYIGGPTDEDHCCVCLDLMPPHQTFGDPMRLRAICCGKEFCMNCRNKSVEVAMKDTVQHILRQGGRMQDKLGVGRSRFS